MSSFDGWPPCIGGRGAGVTGKRVSRTSSRIRPPPSETLLPSTDPSHERFSSHDTVHVRIADTPGPAGVSGDRAFRAGRVCTKDRRLAPGRPRTRPHEPLGRCFVQPGLRGCVPAWPRSTEGSLGEASAPQAPIHLHSGLPDDRRVFVVFPSPPLARKTRPQCCAHQPDPGKAAGGRRGDW